ncbi:MAG: cytochrome c oxidase assembly factor 1 family protein, partial [Bacteroidetes bacterium]|nr:cytochrome c oxidase assembly factor 1 family protein [Bacteroidota bacterium]
LFMIGNITWITLRIKKPILEPYDSNKYASSVDAGLAFIFNNFLLEFWGFCIFLWMIAFIFMSVVFKESQGFEAATDFIEHNEEVLNRFGTINSYGTLITGSVSPTYASLGFSVYGSKNSGHITVEVDKNSGEWRLTQLEIE